MSKKIILHSVVLGYIAMWATRQSPYLAPDGLPDVLRLAHEILKGMHESKPVSDFLTFAQLEDSAIRDRLKLILKVVLDQPQVQAWNTPKNGSNPKYVFVDRYHKINPDADIIDIDALIMNVGRDCLRHMMSEDYN